MTRELRLAAAQMGPVARRDPRDDVVERLVGLLRAAAADGAQLVAFPELALTTFFPRWWFDDPTELDEFFETEMPGPATKPLFDEARRLGVGFSLGFAELADPPDGPSRLEREAGPSGYEREAGPSGQEREAGTRRHYNTTILVGAEGDEIARYRKIHLPGHEQHEPRRPFQHLERAYFDPGPDPFTVHEAFGGRIGLATCNDRRWSETFRVLGLQGAEVVLIGYNTPIHYAPDPDQDRLAAFHNNLVMAAGAYQNGTFVVGVAKGGVEEGVESLADSQIIAPSGEVLARARTTGDEVVVATCDLDWCTRYTRTVFDFARYRRPELYGLITRTEPDHDTGSRP
jgi:predicted amidohydrolase